MRGPSSLTCVLLFSVAPCTSLLPQLRDLVYFRDPFMGASKLHYFTHVSVPCKQGPRRGQFSEAAPHDCLVTPYGPRTCVTTVSSGAVI